MGIAGIGHDLPLACGRSICQSLDSSDHARGGGGWVTLRAYAKKVV